MKSLDIPFVDLRAQYSTMPRQISSAISDVVKTTSFIGGRAVQEFEQAFASFLKVKYCIGVNSGTDALILGMRALNLKKGDEVIIPVNTFVATALAASENGLTPVFVDKEPTGCGIDLEDLARKITKKTKAIIAVHLYGKPEDISGIKRVIKKSGRKIFLIEDACQAHGAFLGNKKVGTFGIFSAFSFYPGKNLGAYGDGGAIVTNNKKLAQKYRKIREYGQSKKYYHDFSGINSRLDAIQASVLLAKLPHLPSWNRKRQRIAAYYLKEISRYRIPVAPVVSSLDRSSVYHLFVIEAKRRNALLEYCRKRGVAVLIHYPIPLNMQKVFAYLKYKRGDFPKAERSAKKIVSLPIYPELTKKQMKYVITVLREFYGK